jgi:glycosyltransferase involved in cell wall biosynthesis
MRLSQRWAKLFGRPISSSRLFLGHEDFDFPATWKLLEIPAQKPDLVHLHNLHGAYFDLRVLPSLSARIPTFVTLHDAWMLAGHCSHSFSCERWRTGCGSCPDLTIYPAIRRDATAYNWRRKQQIYSKSRLHIATPCRWLMEKVMDSILAPAIVSSRLIPHGIDLSVFKPGDRSQARMDLGLPTTSIILMFAAQGIRENIWKDYKTMRSAFEIVSAAMGEKRLIFLALGEESPTERIGNAELRFVPHLSDRLLVAKHYQAADIYVHGARAELWGLSITEAMACGLPVVASNVGGIPDQIAEGQTGFLVPVGDAEQMAERIRILVNDDSLRLDMGRRALRRAQAEFGLARMARKYLNWYEEILASDQSLCQSNDYDGCAHAHIDRCR